MLSSLDRFQSFGSLVMRLTLGAILLAYGYHKIIPHGALDGFVQTVVHLGMPRWLGYVAAFTEFFGGILLIAGLFTRVVSILVVLEMATAIYKVKLHGGLTGPNSMSLPLACLAIALMLVFTGSGTLALDSIMGGRGSR